MPKRRKITCAKNQSGCVKNVFNTHTQRTGVEINVGCSNDAPVICKSKSKLKPSNMDLIRNLFEPVRTEGCETSSVNWDQLG